MFINRLILSRGSRQMDMQACPLGSLPVGISKKGTSCFMKEKFAIPCAGAIIEKNKNGKKDLLMQKRRKSGEKAELGLWEIPAGKIREYENIYSALRREVKEETNLDITYIAGEETCETCSSSGYTVTDVHPYNIIQNMSGGYSILVFIFLCRAEGEIIGNSAENDQVQWKAVEEAEKELREFPEHFYPMHILTLKKYFSNCRP